MERLGRGVRATVASRSHKDLEGEKFFVLGSDPLSDCVCASFWRDWQTLHQARRESEDDGDRVHDIRYERRSHKVRRRAKRKRDGKLKTRTRISLLIKRIFHFFLSWRRFSLLPTLKTDAGQQKQITWKFPLPRLWSGIVFCPLVIDSSPTPHPPASAPASQVAIH